MFSNNTASGDDKDLQLFCWTIRHPLYAKYNELRLTQENLISSISKHEETLRKMRHSLDQVKLDANRAYKDCLEAWLTTEDGLPNDETMLKASCKSYWRYVLIIIQLCRNEETYPFNFVARFRFWQDGMY